MEEYIIKLGGMYLSDLSVGVSFAQNEFIEDLVLDSNSFSAIRYDDIEEAKMIAKKIYIITGAEAIVEKYYEE